MPYIGQSPTSVAFLTDTFSGNGSTTAFTMSVAPATPSSVLVAVSGVLQDPSTYSVSGTTLTFSGAPPTGTGNISARYLGIPASGVTTTAYRTVTEFTATSGQTTFTPPSYTAGFINVYRNGVLLGSADYTATNGTTVVLTTGATAGDLVTVESFLVSSVLNAIPATTGSVGSTYLADASVTQAKIGTNVAGTGPAFSYKSSSGQSLGNAANVKITFTTLDFDTTSGMYASSRFTPTISGYYQISSLITAGGVSGIIATSIWKNGVAYKAGTQAALNASFTAVLTSGIVYLNGSTDYVEIYGIQTSGASISLYADGAYNYFNGVLVKAA
jgi:hypothetical protein